MPTNLEKFRALDKLRVAAVILTIAVAAYTFTIGIRAGIGGSGGAVLLAILFDGVLVGGAMLLALGPTRPAAVLLGAALVAWIAFVVITAPNAIERTWPWWVALGVAAAIAARKGD